MGWKSVVDSEDALIDPDSSHWNPAAFSDNMRRNEPVSGFGNTSDNDDHEDALSDRLYSSADGFSEAAHGTQERQLLQMSATSFSFRSDQPILKHEIDDEVRKEWGRRQRKGKGKRDWENRG